MSNIAVIGGTGLNRWEQLEQVSTRRVRTPFGEPSAPLMLGRLGSHECWFLPRHGEGHKLPPHKINYRANLWALKEAGARRVVAIAAVGGIAKWFQPGRVALPLDLIDYTWGRDHSYSDGSPDAALTHVELTHPYTPALRQALQASASEQNVEFAGEGVMGVTQGPRLETPAEIRRMRRDGCDMVGMTSMPEAALAAELGLEYACLAVSVNWGAGIGSQGIHDEIERHIETGMDQVRSVLASAIGSARE